MATKEEDWEFVRIDRHKLPEMWEQQLPLYMTWHLRWQRRKKKVGLLEAEQKVRVAELAAVKAKLDLLVRKNPTKHGIRRPSEEAFKNWIFIQPAYQRAQRRVLDLNARIVRAQYNTDIADSACRTLYQRKEELQDLVKLEIAGLNQELHISKEELRAANSRALNENRKKKK